MGEARSNTYLGVAGVLLTVSSGIDLALSIWAESNSRLHLWGVASFLIPLAIFALVFAFGAYILVALFVSLPLPTLMHERDAERELEVRQRYAQLIFEGVCLANDSALTSEQLQEFLTRSSNFTSNAFAHEAIQAMSHQALERLGAVSVQTRQESLRTYLDRMTNILDRRAPVKKGFTVSAFDRTWDLVAATGRS